MTDPIGDSAADSVDDPAGVVDDPAGFPVDEAATGGPPHASMSRLADILEQFKAGASRADDDRVNDRPAGGPRLSWEPVTNDADKQAPVSSPPNEQAPGFQFDLGSALQRFKDPTSDDLTRSEPAVAQPDPTRPTADAQRPSDATIADLPVRQRSGGGQPSPVQQQPVVQQQPIPQRPMPKQPAVQQPVEHPTAWAPTAGDVTLPSEQPVQHPAVPASSVFGPTNAAPMLPTQPKAAAHPTSPSLAHTPQVAIPNLPAGAMPTLPAANPVAAPAYTAPIDSAPSTPDLNALRSAQLRANRNQRKGKMLVRSVMAFVLIGVAAGGALTVGRDYLFSTDWDKALIPIVDQMQIERNAQFDHPVVLSTQPADVYAQAVTDVLLGEDWATRLPQWRALGLVSGDATQTTVAAAVSATVTAVYDPDADTIYRLQGATDTASLRQALEQAWAAQNGEDSADDTTPESAPDTTAVGQTLADAPETATTSAGLLGSNPVETLVQRAVDAAVIAASTDEPGTPLPPDSGLPLPIAYELVAVRNLGPALLASVDVTPESLIVGGVYPDGLVEAFDDGARVAAPGVLRPGDIPIGAPTALGVDDWSLVWGARLPAETVDRLGEVLVADSYLTFTRATAACFLVTFQTASEPGATLLYSSLLGWATNAPASAQAVATQLSPTVVQLEACDPGTDALVPDIGSVDSLIARQIERLAT